MSQRLLIALKKNVTSEDDFYDAIFTEDCDIRELLDLVLYYQGIYFGPIKITFRDAVVFTPFNFAFNDLCKLCNKLNGYEDIWCVYYKDKTLEHPTLEELANLLGFTITKREEQDESNI